MSQIAFSAQLIRLAAVDDHYAQNLAAAVVADELNANRLIAEEIDPSEFHLLTPAEWQWYANWRQAHNGPLDRGLLDHLTASASTRFAMFELRTLVMLDRPTNELAKEFEGHPAQSDAVGLNWLSEQASGARIYAALAESRERRGSDFMAFVQSTDNPGQLGGRRLSPEERDREFERRTFDDALFEEQAQQSRQSEALEIMADALQCDTPASLFVLRELTRDSNEYSDLIGTLLAQYALDRGLEEQWYSDPRWHEHGQGMAAGAGE